MAAKLRLGELPPAHSRAEPAGGNSGTPPALPLENRNRTTSERDRPSAPRTIPTLRRASRIAPVDHTAGARAGREHPSSEQHADVSVRQLSTNCLRVRRGAVFLEITSLFHISS